MSLSKVIFIIVMIVLVSGVFFYMFNENRKTQAPDLKRSSLNDIEILRQAGSNYQQSYMEALLKGKLIVEEGCLKLKTDEVNTVYQLIWPFEFEVLIEDKQLVIKLDGEVVGQEGKHIEVSGGEIKDISHLRLVAHKSCVSPPFWLIGNHVKLLN